MSTQSPPFADIGGYTAALASLVKDARVKRSDEDFVADAVKRFSDDVPLIISNDVGDGTTKEWELGTAPFAAWDFGYSEDRASRITAEVLSDSAPQEPPQFLRKDRFRLEWRTESGSQKLYLVFLDAPDASPNQTRVRWTRRYEVDSETNEVRSGHQMAVVYLAAHLKATALHAAYLHAVTGGSTVFDGGDQARDWKDAADNFLKLYRSSIRRVASGLKHGQVRAGVMPVFRRGHA